MKCHYICPCFRFWWAYRVCKALETSHLPKVVPGESFMETRMKSIDRSGDVNVNKNGLYSSDRPFVPACMLMTNLAFRLNVIHVSNIFSRKLGMADLMFSQWHSWWGQTLLSASDPMIYMVVTNLMFRQRNTIHDGDRPYKNWLTLTLPSPSKNPISQGQACFIDWFVLLFTYKLIFKDFRRLYVIRKRFYRRHSAVSLIKLLPLNR